MRKFDLTILGCGAAAPTPSFLTTSQLVNIHDHLILIDCGEGCQLTLRKLKLKFQRIKTVLISHMHADHVMGLPGLLASMNLLGRKTAIDIFGPEELESFVKTIWHKTGTHIDFPVKFNVVDHAKPSLLLEMKSYKIAFLFYKKLYRLYLTYLDFFTYFLPLNIIAFMLALLNNRRYFY